MPAVGSETEKEGNVIEKREASCSAIRPPAPCWGLGLDIQDYTMESLILAQDER